MILLHTVTQTHHNQPRPGHQDDSCSMLFFASWFPHPEKQYFPKNQLSPATHLQSSWKIWVKHFATHTHKIKQKKTRNKKGEGNSSTWSRTFHDSYQTFFKSPNSNAPVPWAAELFLPTLASKEAPHVLINGITQYQGTQNGFERLGGQGN